MCEPATLTALSIGATVLAGGVQAYGQRQQAKYESEVAQQNAKIADMQAENAKQIGSIEEERQRARVRQMIATQRVSFAANNVDAATGTAAEVLGDTAGYGFADAAMIRSNALREAWGFKVDASNERSRAKSARYNGRIGALGTLLTTGAQATGQFANYRASNPRT